MTSVVAYWIALLIVIDILLIICFGYLLDWVWTLEITKKDRIPRIPKQKKKAARHGNDEAAQ